MDKQITGKLTPDDKEIMAQARKELEAEQYQLVAERAEKIRGERQAAIAKQERIVELKAKKLELVADLDPVPVERAGKRAAMAIEAYFEAAAAYDAQMQAVRDFANSMYPDEQEAVGVTL